MDPKFLIDLKNLRPGIRIGREERIKTWLWLGVAVPAITSLGILSLFLLYLSIKVVWKLIMLINNLF